MVALLLLTCCGPGTGIGETARERREEIKRGRIKKWTEFTTEPPAGWLTDPLTFTTFPLCPQPKADCQIRVRHKLWSLDCTFSAQANCLNENGMSENVFIRVMEYAFAVGSGTNVTIFRRRDDDLCICIHRCHYTLSYYILQCFCP